MRWNRLFAVALAVALAACALSACEHGDAVVDGGDGDGNRGGTLEPTLASIQANIFSVSCAVPGCHTGPGAAAGMNLSAGSARSSIVGVPSSSDSEYLRVDPGHADDSYLIMKLAGDARIAGQRMPLGRSPLASSEIDVIRAWIDAGAD